nr:uncharacterized protein LOC120962697 [Aegilops tauschii subsp. strangulata]
MAGHAANADAASIWGTSTAASSIAVSRRSSSDRGGFGTAVHIAQRRAPLPPPHAVHCQSQRDLPSWGHQGQLASKIGGGSVISAVNDGGSEAAIAPPAPCSSVGRPVQLGWQARAARLPPPCSSVATAGLQSLLPNPNTRRRRPAIPSPRCTRDTPPQGSSLLPPATVAEVHSALSLPLEFCYALFFRALDAVRSDRARSLDGSLMRFTFKCTTRQRFSSSAHAARFAQACGLVYRPMQLESGGVQFVHVFVTSSCHRVV